jgi:hypothetical protein
MVPIVLIVPPDKPPPAVTDVTVPPAVLATTSVPSAVTCNPGPSISPPFEYLTSQDAGEEKAAIYYSTTV